MMQPRHLAYLVLCLCIFLASACAQETPAPAAQTTTPVPTFTPSPTQQQPASPLVVVVTRVVTQTVMVHVTPTATPTQTPLPRERLSAVPGMDGWLYIDGFGNYGTPGGYNLKSEDYLFRARFRAEDWDLVGGPALRSRANPDCTLYFFVPGLALPRGYVPPTLFTTQVLPAEMASTFARYNMIPESHYLGSDPQLGNACQRLAQTVVDTLQLAPPSPGYVATPTPAPAVYVEIDARDPAWSIYNKQAFDGRLAMYYPTGVWQFVDYNGGALRYMAIPACYMQIEWGPPDRAQGEISIEPQVALAYLDNSIDDIIATYAGLDAAERDLCFLAAQRIANSVHWISNSLGSLDTSR